MNNLLSKACANDFRNIALIEMPIVDNFLFLKKYIIEINTSVDTKLIIGTQHDDYLNNKDTQDRFYCEPKERNWAYILEYGKRIKHNLEEFEKKPDYYISKEPKEHISYYLIKNIPGYTNKYFIEAGNHRTAIAKFHLCDKEDTKIYGVGLTTYEYDKDLRDGYELLLQTVNQDKNSILIKHQLSNKTSSNGNTTETYDNSIVIRNVYTEKAIELKNFQEIIEYVNQNKSIFQKIIDLLNKVISK